MYVLIMPFLTLEDIEQVWSERGLRHRVRRLRAFLVEHGLTPLSVTDEVFEGHIRKRLLIDFFVNDVHEDKHGNQTKVG